MAAKKALSVFILLARLHIPTRVSYDMFGHVVVDSSTGNTLGWAVKFKSDHKNSLPGLAELKAKVLEKESGEGRHEVLVELRVFPYEFEQDNIGTIYVEVIEGTLSLQLAGLEVAPRTRFGERVVAPILRDELRSERTVTVTFDKEKTSTVGGSAGGALSGFDAKIEGNRGSAEKSSRVIEEKTSRAELTEYHQVEAVGDNNWKLTMKGGTALHGAILNYDALCEVAHVDGSNRVGIELEFVVKQRNINKKLLRKISLMPWSVTTTQKKISEILIARSLHHAASSDRPFEGWLTFSRTQCFDEG